MRFVTKYLDPDTPDAEAIRDQINKAVRGSHPTFLRVWVADYDPDMWHVHPWVDPTGWNEPNFNVLRGSITESLNEAVTRQLGMTVASEYWVDPFDALKDLSPYRTLIAVSRGIETPSGPLNVPLGVYRVRNVVTSGSGEGSTEISFQAYSMEADIRDARFLETPIAGVGTGRLGVNTIEDILNVLVQDAFTSTTPGGHVPFDVNGTGYGLDYAFPDGAVLSNERDRLDLIFRLEDDRNVWGRFDRGNHYALDTLPSLADTPQPFTVNTGSDGVVVSYGKEFLRERVYNAVLAFGEYGGEDSDDPKIQVSYLAVDDDVASPTYWDGPFGKVPRFQRVGFLPNDGPTALDIVTEAAESILARSKEFKAGISLDMVPNILLEAGDVITVELQSFTQDEPPVVETHLINSITIGLASEDEVSIETSSTELPDEEI